MRGIYAGVNDIWRTIFVQPLYSRGRSDQRITNDRHGVDATHLHPTLSELRTENSEQKTRQISGVLCRIYYLFFVLHAILLFGNQGTTV
jgi:hypothetical protein